jgi:hypothetical protein
MKKILSNLNPLKVMNVWRDEQKSLLQKIITSIPLGLILLIIIINMKGKNDEVSRPTNNEEVIAQTKVTNNPSTPEELFNYVTTRKFKQNSDMLEEYYIYEYLSDSTYTEKAINKRSEKIVDEFQGKFYTGKAKYLGGDGEFLYIKKWAPDSRSDQYNGGWSIEIYDDRFENYLLPLSFDKWEGIDEYGPRVNMFQVTFGDHLNLGIQPIDK